MVAGWSLVDLRSEVFVFLFVLYLNSISKAMMGHSSPVQGFETSTKSKCCVVGKSLLEINKINYY